LMVVLIEASVISIQLSAVSCELRTDR